jgi:hypothetical protein
MSTRRDILLALPLLGAGWVGMQSMLTGPVGTTTAIAPATLQVADARPVAGSEARARGVDARIRSAEATPSDTASADAR